MREIVNCALEGSVRMSKAEERVRGLRRGVCPRTADEKLVNESEKKSDTRNVRDEWMPARRVRAVDRSADAARERFLGLSDLRCGLGVPFPHRSQAPRALGVCFEVPTV